MSCGGVLACREVQSKVSGLIDASGLLRGGGQAGVVVGLDAADGTVSVQVGRSKEWYTPGRQRATAERCSCRVESGVCG